MYNDLKFDRNGSKNSILKEFYNSLKDNQEVIEARSKNYKFIIFVQS